MKQLMITTALSTLFAAGALAQDGMTGSTPDGGSQASVPAYLASNLTGKTLYTLDSETARELRAQGGSAMDGNGMSVTDRDSLRWTSSDTFLADRDSWENVGAINDVVLSQDGLVRGVVLDVGGFLGFGAHTVMMPSDDIYFVTEDGAPEDIDDFSVVIAMSQEELEQLPEWNAEQLRDGFAISTAERPAAPAADDGGSDMAETRPGPAEDAVSAEDAVAADTRTEPANGMIEIFTSDHTMLEGDERTADRLIGAEVHDASGEPIGVVDDVVLDGNERATGLLVDVGGLLGIGAHTVNLPIESARIGWNADDGDTRVQVSMTAGQLEAMPEHES